MNAQNYRTRLRIREWLTALTVLNEMAEKDRLGADPEYVYREAMMRVGNKNVSPETMKKILNEMKK